MWISLTKSRSQSTHLHQTKQPDATKPNPHNSNEINRCGLHSHHRHPAQRNQRVNQADRIGQGIKGAETLTNQTWVSKIDEGRADLRGGPRRGRNRRRWGHAQRWGGRRRNLGGAPLEGRRQCGDKIKVGRWMGTDGAIKGVDLGCKGAAGGLRGGIRTESSISRRVSVVPLTYNTLIRIYLLLKYI
jgi:hypothetical protein